MRSSGGTKNAEERKKLYKKWRKGVVKSIGSVMDKMAIGRPPTVPR